MVLGDFCLLVDFFLQKELDSVKELERQASMKQSLDALESKNQHATLLENQVAGLQKKLQEAEAHYREKVGSYTFRLSK